MTIELFVNNPVKVSMLFLALVLMGLLSLRRLPLNLFPDVQTPHISVVAATTGLAPEEAERRLTIDLERQLSSIRGVSAIASYSRENSIVFQLDFHWGTNIELAYLDVKRGMGSFEANPEVKSVEVIRFDPNATALMTLALTGEVDRMRLTNFIENSLQPRLETVKGVAYVRPNGLQHQEVRVRLNEDVMTGYRLTPEQTLQAINNHNINSAGGAVIESGQQMLLKFVSRFQNLNDIGRCVITVIDGFPIHLEDLGQIELEPTREFVRVHQDGRPSISIDIYREPDANAVLTARAVRELVEQFNRRGDIGLTIAIDRSEEVERAIESLIDAGLVGMLLAMVVLWLFLRNLLATAIISLAIPISIVATFSLMHFQGLSLNLMTLGGLALGSGMLVDNAVVVIENVFRHRRGGAQPRAAAVVATREVAAAIIASTLTTVVVFVPLVYVHGIAGVLFRDQAMTIVYSLLLSLLVALVLIPVLAARIPRGGEPIDGWMIRGYGGLLRALLRLRWLWLCLFVVALFVGWQRLTRLPTEFFPEAVGERLTMLLEMPPGTPLDRTEQAVSQVEQLMLGIRYRDPEVAPLLETYRSWRLTGDDPGFLNQARLELAQLAQRRPEHPLIGALGPLAMAGRLDDDQRLFIHKLLDPWIVVRSLTATIGAEEGDILAADETIRGSHTARLEVVLNPDLLAEMSAADLVEPLRAQVARVPGLTCAFESRDEYMQQLLGRSRGDLVIEVHAEKLPDLQAASAVARAAFLETPGLTGARTNLVLGEEQYVLTPDNDALLRQGIGIEELSQQIQAYLGGKQTDKLKLAQGEVPIALVTTRVEHEGLDGLLNLEVLAQTGEGRDKLANLARVDRQRSVAEIMRVGQERSLLVMADLQPGARYDSTLAALRRRLDRADWPVGASWNVSVEEARRRESFDRLLFALVIAIVLVYMVIASILESVVHPLTIMLTIPFALVGVVAAFVVTGVSLNLMGLIGLVVLAGVVVNNAIVLLDRIRQVRQSGLAPAAAVVEAARQRLRPILMTSLTTILALIPLAMGLGSGAELRRPLAVAVIGGMVSSTLLTLVILPAIYLCVEDVLNLLFRRRPASAVAADMPK